jgi:hypothetical protein
MQQRAEEAGLVEDVSVVVEVSCRRGREKRGWSGGADEQVDW